MEQDKIQSLLGIMKTLSPRDISQNIEGIYNIH